MESQKFSLKWGGRDLVIEIGKLAGQASGSCVVTLGGTTVLGTATMSEGIREVDFFPLTVEFEERFYAAGKIKGSRFIKREGRPSDEAVLTGRLIDRGIRPLFDNSFRNEIQVVVTALSFDGENDPDVPGIIAASCALAISEIPWGGPIAGIRIGRIDGKFIINSTYKERDVSDFDIVLSGTPDRVLMLEAKANEVPENIIEEAIRFGQEEIKDVIALLEKIIKKCGKKKSVIEETSSSESGEITSKVDSWICERLPKVLFSAPLIVKDDRKSVLQELKEGLDLFLLEKLGVEDEEECSKFQNRVKPAMERAVTKAILEKGRRVDGRKLDEVRSLAIEVGLLPRTHGSGLFQRGETQVLSVVTLGAPGLVQTLDTMEESGMKRYMHHYNFPPYSVGETKPMRGPGRREIGHGALAEKALEPVLPTQEEFPYAIRVVSEVLSSNGSSSMASTCGSTLALMDAGVPIKKPVAGIAMGLASEGDFGVWKIITDAQDLEDGEGGMDFKISGTRDGITAIQMDTKTKGLIPEVVKEALKQALTARLKILDAICDIIAKPRPELSPYAPRITSFMIPQDRIRDVIGPGGKIIHEIINATGVEIDIDDSGLVMVTGTDELSAKKAVEWIKNLTRTVEVGETFEGKVTRLFDFGAMVQILPNQEGLIHISELADWHVGRVEDIVKIGDAVPVKVISIDDQGRVNLSLKAMRKIEPPAGYDVNNRPPRREPGGHQDFRRGGGQRNGRRPMRRR